MTACVLVVSYVTVFIFIYLSSGCTLQSPDEIVEKALCSSDGSVTCEDFVSLVQSWLNKIQVIVPFLLL